VSGEVIHGAHLGRKIGYPTANVVPPPALVPLADGIYASYATLPDRAGPRPAMTYVGTRPTVDGGPRLVETHLFDFSADLYGQIIVVDVLERLRGDATFASLDELVAQLRRDEEAARAVLASEPALAGARGD
jgi:riboflavin kinase/FMN adenylyltransferase